LWSNGRVVDGVISLGIWGTRERYKYILLFDEASYKIRIKIQINFWLYDDDHYLRPAKKKPTVETAGV